MKTQRKILVAFLLNLFFAVFEFLGGIFTGSVAIASDAIHDIGDAVSIGAAYFFEKKSNKAPDDQYTYGYKRYSVVGSVITITILLVGSILVIYNSVLRIINPTPINYNGMIIFSAIGTVVNLIAALFTSGGHSLNQKAVSLHMLEDVLGWIVVLVGAVVMRFTDIKIIDPIMSIGVATFILINASATLKEVLDLFLEKAPDGVSVDELREHAKEVDGVIDIHHIHVWSMDGYTNYATMHVVVNSGVDCAKIKSEIKAELSEHGIAHATLELETEGEKCEATECHVEEHGHHSHHHHHHHHH